MCDPTGGLLIAAAAVSAAGSVVQGIQAKQQGDYQASVARINQNLAAQDRRTAIDQGVVDQVREDRKAAQLQGQQRVALAGAGVDTTFGTAGDLAGDASLIASENRQDIVTNTDRQARGFAIQSMNYGAQAQAAKMQGNSALVNGLFQAGGTILGGATQVKKYQAGQRYGFNGYDNSGLGKIY